LPASFSQSATLEAEGLLPHVYPRAPAAAGKGRTYKVYKSQAPVIEQAMDTAALMLGSDKSRGYCLEMICADFLAGAVVLLMPHR